MIDINLLDIKFCLILVFFIGLLTGYFFTRRVSKEEYLPIINKYKKSIKDNIIEIKNNETNIQKYNQEISKIRNKIKEYKQNVGSLEESLLNTEHLYSKTSTNSDDITKEIEDQQKIEKSLKKELNFYQDMIDKQKNIKSNDQALGEDIEKLKKEIDNLSSKSAKLTEELKKQEKLVETQSEQIAKKEKKLLESVKILEQKRNNLKNNPTFLAFSKLEDLTKELKQYKEKILKIKEEF